MPRINVRSTGMSLPAETIERLDAAATRLGTSRARVVAVLADRYADSLRIEGDSAPKKSRKKTATAID